MFCCGRAVVDVPKFAVAFFAGEFEDSAAQGEGGFAVVIGDEAGVQTVVDNGFVAVVHDVGVKQQGVVCGVRQVAEFRADEFHPAVEDGFQVIRGDLGADDAAVFDAVAHGLQKGGLVFGYAVNDEVVVDVGRDLGDEFAADLAGGFAPCDFFVAEDGGNACGGHERGFFVVDDTEQRRQKQGFHVFAFVISVADVIQKLREHGVYVCGLMFGFKPDFFGLNIYQAFGNFFQFQRADISIFYIFFALGGLEFLVQVHGIFL